MHVHDTYNNRCNREIIDWILNKRSLDNCKLKKKLIERLSKDEQLVAIRMEDDR